MARERQRFRGKLNQSRRFNPKRYPGRSTVARINRKHVATHQDARETQRQSAEPDDV